MLLFIHSLDCSFFQSSNVKCLLSDRHFVGRKDEREGGGESHVIKSDGTRGATLDGEVRESHSKEVALSRAWKAHSKHSINTHLNEERKEWVNE